MCSPLDVHYYDGNWGDVDRYIDKITNIPSPLKQDHINSLRSRLTNGKIKISPIAILNFNTIAATNTFDPSNKIHVYDLLYILEELCKEYEDPTDLLNIMVEQLEDLSSGLCTQGRTTRLYQIMVSFVKEEMLP